MDAYDKVKISNKHIQKRTKCKVIKYLSSTLICKYCAVKISNKEIKMHHRLSLAFKSYFELIFNFSILYALIPESATYWDKDSIPLGIVNSIYFSGVTITTLGYGDISPVHWYPQFLSVYEVLCGFTLIVVCFAVYLSRNET
jgi:voltage-gated potassium channel